ncbi:hypothetical protein XENOCAPTIV_016544 [Xenoophorus captivus]|uniref:Uncharacterized protein n=1 Tax=Xenoophorus captivus TaxID=1517983 RepID=A0ABV0QM55_9TELE
MSERLAPSARGGLSLSDGFPVSPGVASSSANALIAEASHQLWPGRGPWPSPALLPPAVCGVPPSCVCQRQFGLIYKLLTHGALDPSSAAGMAIPCVCGRSTWVVLRWMGVRCGFAQQLQRLRGACPADSVEEEKHFQKNLVPGLFSS